MKARFALLFGVVLTASPVLLASGLDQETAKAWDEYVRNANSQMQQRASGSEPFLWLDQAPGRREAVRVGQVLAEPTQKQSPEHLPHALVYDWIGAAFFPKTTIRQIFQVLSEFDRYDEFYNPTVVSAKLLESSGQSQRFSVLVAEKNSLFKTAFDSEYSSKTTCLDQRRCYNIIYSTRIQQIEDYKTPSARELPPDQGVVYRLYSIQRYEEQDGGVYAELETIALSRDIPLEFRWLIKPLLQHLPRNSMMGTLEKTRDAVCATRRDEAELNHAAAEVHYSVLGR